MTKWFAPATLAAAVIALSPAAAQTGDDFPDRPITRTEVVAKVKTMFGQIDANHDGVVTHAEFSAYLDRTRATPAGGDPFTHVGPHWFEHNDADGDGRVTLAEAEARPLQMFDMADVNKDGVVSVQERQVAMAFKSLGGR
jgi:Ca2+-binding EF-hand superfamily protein